VKIHREDKMFLMLI